VSLWTPHPHQETIANNKARFKVVVCGRRFGKTTLAVNLLVEEALLHDDGLFFYVAPTYAQAKMIAWEMLARQVRKLPGELVTKVNEFALYVEIGNGSRIYLKGSDNPDSLRGVGLDGVVLDEYATMKANVFDEILRPALLDKKGWAMFIGTPKGLNHFHDLYERVGSGKLGSDWARWRFSSYDNPVLDPQELELERKTKAEDLFAQEYLAEFRRFTGLVYKDWEPSVHVVADMKPDSSWPVYVGGDFGFHNPTAILWVAVDYDDNWHVFDELYVRETPTEDNVRVAKQKTGTLRITDSYGDPAAAQLLADWGRLGFPFKPASREIGAGATGWVESGINVIAARLKRSPVTGKPRLFVSSRCANLIAEFGTYQWEERRGDEKNASPVPRKLDDHALDALRYLAVSLPSADLGTASRRPPPKSIDGITAQMQALEAMRGQIKNRPGRRSFM